MINMNIMRPTGFSNSAFKKHEKDADNVRRLGGYRPISACPVCRSKQRRLECSKFGIDIFCCSECDLAYSGLHPNDFNDLYSDESYLNNSKSAYDESREYRISRFGKERVEILRAAKPEAFTRANAPTLLDIGCGTGWFLEYACESFDAKGVEYSDSLRAFLSQNYTFQVCKATDELSIKFDFITAFDVIEHVPDPLLFLREVRRLLKPNGVALIYTPNRSSLAFLANVDDNNLICPPHHLHYFNDTSFRRALEIENLELISHVTRGLDYPDIFSAMRDNSVINDDGGYIAENLDVAQDVLDQLGFANHSRFIIGLKQ
jgi:SAM-dependent methyltransferase